MRLGRAVSLLIVFLALLQSRPAYAQSAGSLSGRVVDSTGNPLPATRVTIEALGRTTIADADGHFVFSSLPVGAVTLRAAYIGFGPASLTVTVKSGMTVTANLVLQRLTTALPEISVRSARSRGEAKALNQQQDAQNIVNVIPSEIITSLPNTNIADAVGRVPGVTLERDEGEGKYVQIRGTEPRLTSLTINGVRVPNPEAAVRNAKLDVIPSELVGAIEVHKTLQADMEGDAIGGTVNLVTRAAEDRPFLLLGGYGGLTALQGGVPLYQGVLAYGRRFGDRKQFGFSIGGSYDYNARGIDDIEPSVGTGSFNGVTQPIVPTAIDLREYAYYRRRMGVAGQLDYRLAPASLLYVKGLFSDFHNYGDRWVTSLSPGGFNQSPTISDTTGEVDKSVQQRRPNEQVYSILAGGDHTVGGVRVEYGVAVSRAQQILENGLTASWATDADANPVAFTGNATNPNRPKLAVANGVNINDPTLYGFSSYNIQNSQTFDRSLAGKLDLTVPLTVGNDPGAFKFGGAVRDELKVNNTVQNYYSSTGAGGPNLSQVLSTFSNSNYYFGDYALGPLADANAFLKYAAANPGNFKLNVNKTRAGDGNSYRVKERVYAGYAMITQRFGQVDLQAGVRIENTASGYVGNQVAFNAAGNYVSTTPTNGTSSYTNVLPSASLKYVVDPLTNVRAIFGEGIARPNFADLPPYQVENDRSKSLSVGNPNLQPTRANNFDLLFEHYFASVGVISAGAFYKDLHNYIGPNQTTVASGPFAGYTQVQQINLPTAHVLGVEVAWQQHLYFLPGALGGLGIAANYTYNDSKATVPGRTDTPRLLRTSPSQWNVGVTYDRGGFSGRIAAQHNGASIYQYNYVPGADLGDTGPNGDVFLLARTQIDAQISYRFTDSGVQLFGNVLNLNNAAFGFYQGSPQYLIQREFYGPSFTVGARLTR